MNSFEKMSPKGWRGWWSYRRPSIGTDHLRLRRHANRDREAQFATLMDPVNSIYAAIRGLMETSTEGIVVQIVSATPGEGASSVARAVAQKAVGFGKLRTFLIDGNDTGQGSAFSAIKKLEHYNPHVPADDRSVDDPSNTRAVYAACRREFQLTIVDSPPIAGGRFFDTLPNLSDGVVLVVQAEKLRPQMVRQVSHLLEQHGVRLLGLVLNKTRSYIPNFLQRFL